MAAKRQKNKVEAEMTKRKHHKGLRVRRSKPENLKSKALSLPRRSEVPFPLHELEKKP